jgi:hypothetical protein
VRKLLSGRRLAWLIAGCSLGLFATNANAQSSDAIQWSITPYIWASDTTVEQLSRDIATALVAASAESPR